MVICGSVDHGKSTLVGRLLAETGALPEGKEEAIRAACVGRGVAFEWAFLTDALQAERDQNVTIDSAQIVLRTATQSIVLVDAPGHEEFLKNMITGAATADAALLLVAADEGWRAQSRRHAYLLGLLGLKQVVVVVTKMDRAGYAQGAFETIQREGGALLGSLGLTPIAWIPVSAREGEGISRASERMPWAAGTNVLSALGLCEPPQPIEGQPLRFVVQDVYRQGDRRVVAGRVESGTIAVGDAITLWPFLREATVATIERWPTAGVPRAGAGESIGLTLVEPVFVARGYVLSHRSASPIVSNQVQGSAFWIDAQPLAIGDELRLKLGTQDIAGRVSAIGRAFDPANAEPALATASEVPRNGAAELTIQLREPLVFDQHTRVAALGRFVLLRDKRIAGGGVITGGTYAERRTTKSANLTESTGTVRLEDRVRRNGHRGGVIWLTGLSGAGKSTLARAVERAMFDRAMQVSVLDGDNLRRGLASDLGFSPADRVENIRRAAEAARLIAETGGIVLVALISPYRADRAAARRIVLEGGCDFIEIFVQAPLAVCEDRDPKKLYQKARAGLIKEFTGIDAPYEEPENPELVVRTDQMDIAGASAVTIDFVLDHLTGPRGADFVI